jgi:SAM-dependent methyltransferase
LTASTPLSCCCCGASLATGLARWHFTCPKCGYEQALLRPSINESAAHSGLDEALRDAGLKPLRQDNFRELLERVARLRPAGTMLEVGSAHGWFLEQARAQGFEATGLEPDEAVFTQAQACGVPVRSGYFPQALAAGERFDAIVFNDVFEHIPDAVGTMRACHERLNEGGLLVINLPSSRGIFYRVARWLQRIGARGPFDRMWQVGLPSPHLHYFNADNLTELGKRNGMERADAFHLASIRLRGLYARIACVRGGRFAAPFIWLGVVIAMPLLALLPSDIDVVVFRRA